MINNLKNNIVAVIRIKNYELAKAVAENIIASGINFIELTLTIENASKLIRELNEKYKEQDVFIGAGTVTTLDECKEVLDSNAAFVVSPITNFEVIDYCICNNVPILPGIGTVTEAYNCYIKGCEVVKVFPGNVLGHAFIKSALAPLPQIKFMPSGGVTLENMNDWFDNGAYAVSIGSELYSGITLENIETIRDRVENYLKNLPK
ncbi:MAG: bifunctional 4-hydroxy-2-oxoglutarate aldolase/2-dehydro-3-deoxy-phosphogluconate aldolase [Lachnospirales bacterium]